MPRAQVALAWVLHQPAVTAPIIGATKPGHLADAVAAVDLELTDDEVAQLEEPYTPAGGRRLQLTLRHHCGVVDSPRRVLNR